MPIKPASDRVPGRMRLVSLLLGAIVHTILPTVGEDLGSFTGGLFDGSLALLAVFYFCLDRLEAPVGELAHSNPARPRCCARA